LSVGELEARAASFFSGFDGATFTAAGFAAFGAGLTTDSVS
jgi:hypothetical protein